MNHKEKASLEVITYNLKELSKSVSNIRYIHKNTNDIVSNDQLIAKFNICKKTAYNWRKNGLKYHKKLKMIFYFQEDIVKYLTSESSEYFIKNI